MSHEGVTLIARAALVLVTLAVSVVCRAFASPGRRGNAFMLAGTVAGIASGVTVASLIRRLGGTDLSGLAACLGMMAGWGVAAAWSRRVDAGA